jgi:hypothetical protein
VLESARLPQLLAANCQAFAVAAHFPPRTWIFRVTNVGAADAAGSCAAANAYRQANQDRDLSER